MVETASAAITATNEYKMNDFLGRYDSLMNIKSKYEAKSTSVMILNEKFLGVINGKNNFPESIRGTKGIRNNPPIIRYFKAVSNFMSFHYTTGYAFYNHGV